MKKTLIYQVKDLKAPDSKGTFTAHVAETHPADAPKNKADSQGDIFEVGAFDEQDGESVPVYYQHDYAPTSEVGQATLQPKASREVLPAKGQLFVGQGRPMAEGVYESMLLPNDNPHALKEFSVGYEFEMKDISQRDDGIRVIHKSRVAEISVVYAGAQRTELVSIKNTANTSATTDGSNYTITIHNPPVPEVKAGRTISQKNEQKLRAAIESINEVLDSLPEAPEEKQEIELTVDNVDEVLGANEELLDINRKLDVLLSDVG